MFYHFLFFLLLSRVAALENKWKWKLNIYLFLWDTMLEFKIIVPAYNP